MKSLNSPSLRKWRKAAAALALVLAGAGPGQALAQTGELANAPLFTSSVTAVKPNILFLLDDSGSMAWDFLPDAASAFASNEFGKWSSHCNGLAFNPASNYQVPVDANGVSLGDAPIADYIMPRPSLQLVRLKTSGTTLSKTDVAVDATPWIYVNNRGNLNINQTVTAYREDANNFSHWFTGKVIDTSGDWVRIRVAIRNWPTTTTSFNSWTFGEGEPVSGEYYTYKGTQPRLGFVYNSSGDATTNTFYNECNATAAFPSTKFNRVVVTPGSAEAQDYANWAKYYRDRMITMKSATSIAFKGVDSRYRLGYTTINKTDATEDDNFLDIRDFDSTQKATFYSKFNAAAPVGSTPLRGALAKAGQYFANKARNQSSDPVQYACQRNFAILSTDGMWNTAWESSTYGPKQLDRSTNVGQQDGDIPRPMLDGNSVTVTVTDSWTSTTVTTTTDIFPRVQNTRLISGTVTDTITSRLQRTTYSAPRRDNVDNDEFQRPGWGCAPNCWVNVSIDNHGYDTGDEVRITGGNESDYRGTFTVEKVNNNTFRYKLSFRPDSARGRYDVYPPEAASCSSGRRARTVSLLDEISRATTSRVQSTTTTFQVTEVTTRTNTQTHTWVVQEINGTPQAGVQNDGPLRTSTATVSTPAQTGITTDTFVTTATQALTDGWNVIDSNCTTTNGTDTTVSVTPPTVPPTTTASNPTTVTDGTKAQTVQRTTSDSPRVTVTAQTSTGGVSNSLADVASFYYRTDLRTAALSNCTGAAGVDVCENKVPGRTADAYHSFGDAASWQHMTTFTLGLGVSGTLNFDPNYRTVRSGDFHRIVNRQLNWPTPQQNEPTTIDDLWHAAVNGRGQYFSAGDPSSLTQGLNSALAAIQAITGAASAASTSSLQPVEGDNDIYVAQFTTQEWVGDVLAYKIDPTNGSISSSPSWSAKERLNTKDPSTRTIYYARPTGGALRTFDYATLTADGLNGLFDGFCSKTAAGGTGAPDQCAGLNSTDLTSADSGATLVDYLRGNQTLTFYRSRTARLGDIINASPLFVGKPGFKYTENDYQSFVSSKANRTAVVLAAANDGMLHAFAREDAADASYRGGDELWAFMPSFVLPDVYKLADRGYTNHHSYFVDGSPQIGDIYVGGAWKTIVVGGLNKGGRGYYALDVTNPVSPQLLWEFRHDDLGFSFGNPIITKRVDGTWVVVFGSGYDNVAPGDGNGHLFVVNANTGALIEKVSTFTDGASTPAGTTTEPSGLARLNTWVDSELVNTSRRFYGGDLKGNLWRFDIDDLVEPHGKALLLARMEHSDGTPQPITTRPALAEVEYNSARYPVVYVATGVYLRTRDVTDTSVQSVYAIKDPLTSTGYGNIRDHANFVDQTIVGGTDANGRPTRTSTANTVDWSTKSGWRVDFPVGGERVSVNPQLALETLYVGSNLPNADACTVGGESFLYLYNINSGSSTAVYVGNVLVQGLTVVQLTQGAAAGSIVTIITRSDGTLQTEVGAPSSSSSNLRRTSWRELVD